MLIANRNAPGIIRTTKSDALFMFDDLWWPWLMTYLKETLIIFGINKIMFKKHGVCPMLSPSRYFYPNRPVPKWPWLLGSREVRTERVSSHFWDKWPQTYWDHDPFLDHVTSSIMWPFDSPWAISYWCLIGTEPLSSTFFWDIRLQKPCARTHTHTPQCIALDRQ